MSAGFFDELAPAYREIADARWAYLDAVDALVVRHVQGRSLLDVGAGDGRRALSIATRAGFRRVVLCEPSEGMRRLCAALEPPPGLHWEVRDLCAEDLGRLDERFDAVTCLWNVLGHVPTPAARVAALRAMAARLEKGGRLCLDVNNRYNARAYGLLRTLRNRVRDRRHPDGADGERPLSIVVGGRTVRGRGWLFAPREMDALFAEAGLRVVERAFVDYRTGEAARSARGGQLFYVLEPRT
jgi:SAM-dependent methyltransferase